MSPTSYISLEPKIQKLLLRAIGDAKGLEVCGLLIATGPDQSFWRLRNLIAEVGGFWLDPVDLEGVEHAVARSGGHILAFLHSQTSSTKLSPQDDTSLAQSKWPWIVVRACSKRTLRYAFYPSPSKSKGGKVSVPGEGNPRAMRKDGVYVPSTIR